MSKKENDIVTDILQRAMDTVRAELGPGGLDRVSVESLVTRIGALEKPVRQYWGGSEPYVAARSPMRTEVLNAALEEAGRTGKVAAAGAKHGVSRATMYRLLARR